MSWKEEIPFILKDNEKIILHNEPCYYVGERFVLKTTGWGLGSGALSLSFGSFSSKTKNEKELERTVSGMFATNERLVFIKYKTDWIGGHGGGYWGYGDMVAEIPYEHITSVKKDKHWMLGSHIKLEIGVGVDKISIELSKCPGFKYKWWDKRLLKWEETIKQNCELAKQRIKDSTEQEKEETSHQALKFRLAKGEITIQEYEKIKKILVK